LRLEVEFWEFLAHELSRQLAADGEVEDGLAELRDLLGAGGEAREVVDIEVGVFAKGFWIRAVVEVMQGCRRKAVSSGLPVRLRRLQAVAEAHEFGDFGHDPLLFGKRRKSEHELVHIFAGDAGN
jgi:hypothetical protein